MKTKHFLLTALAALAVAFTMAPTNAEAAYYHRGYHHHHHNYHHHYGGVYHRGGYHSSPTVIVHP